MSKPIWTPSEERHKNDFYPTPREATEALLTVEDFEGLIWEPASGKGHISKVLTTAGYKVVSSDLHAKDYSFGLQHDFLSSKVLTCVLDEQGLVSDIVTNPPFSRLREFINQAVTFASRKVAMFISWEALGVDANLELFEEIGFPTVYLLGPKLDIETERGLIHSTFFHCWCVWDQNKPKRGFYCVKPLRWKKRKEK